MSPTNAPVGAQGRMSLEAQLDVLLAAREEPVALIKRAAEASGKLHDKADRVYQDIAGDAPQRLAEVDGQLTAFLERNHVRLARRLSKTIKRDQGEVKIVLRASELDMPKDEAELIEFLLKRSGGKRYLTLTWKVNRRALHQAPAKLFGLLAPFGVWRGRHRTISVQSPSSEKATQLSRRRYNSRQS